ncbi:MAG: prepilin peptidase [Lachnospira sp.]
MISYLYTVIWLLVFSASDVKRKSVSLVALIISFLGVPVIKILEKLLKKDMVSISQMAIIMGLGMLFMLVSHVTKMIGMADCITFVLIGILNGFKKAIVVLLLSLFAVSICAIIVLLTKKMKPKDELPFIPFMTVAFAGVWLWM